jgi:NCAIR mutase (PurE)-related protein
MDPAALRALLERVRAGESTVDEAMQGLRELPFKDLGFAVVDHHRALRSGWPEVILGLGKSPEQIVAIAREIDSRGQRVLVTRASAEAAEALVAALPDTQWDPTSRTAVLSREPSPVTGRGPICIVTAGTSDLPVADEAAITARLFGNEVTRLTDVGVAGVHRLLHRRDVLDDASVIVVVAGMEGALASVVGGLVRKPVIAVPTSIGYGASFEGVAALLGMLNSCAAGVTVVNIDNGFGAAYAASLINRRSER